MVIESPKNCSARSTPMIEQREDRAVGAGDDFPKGGFGQGGGFPSGRDGWEVRTGWPTWMDQAMRPGKVEAFMESEGAVVTRSDGSGHVNRRQRTIGFGKSFATTIRESASSPTPAPPGGRTIGHACGWMVVISPCSGPRKSPALLSTTDKIINRSKII